MQLEKTEREVAFMDPEMAPEVELHFHCDGAAEQFSAEPQSANAQAVESNSATPSQAASGQFNYEEFSARFGKTAQPCKRHRLGEKWDGRFKQIFNTVYFTAGTLAIAYVCLSWRSPMLWPAIAVFSVIALAAVRAVWNTRAHPKDFAVNLSRRTRRSIRAAALIIPLPFFAIIAAQPLADQQLREGQLLFGDGKYNDAITHFKWATRLNPVMEQAYMELADCYNYTYEHEKSLANSAKAINLDPTDGAAWASKAWALNAENKYAEALPAALNAVELYPEGGQGNHALADAYFNLGQYEKALAPASKHIEIHDTEWKGYDLRADILEKLGRVDEAAKDRATAAKLAEN